ncbi:SMP-30/gluconolactonase/LRE family protein [Rhodococcus pyridinivorans]|uniref:SMP-30/gluconolactonase/LRE family protein n=1 Tax=Rhodococcus pyridinivorans TaxID=103816 RepID=UPI001E4BD9C8|nr:SMP-30/gluconolactonase/LRE family protein [Rhodococcus pyridinivorans]MCD5421157.1 SMP-30/gluconolactonase/LRE family protein [Rhodococcus pyridinivorans]
MTTGNHDATLESPIDTIVSDRAFLECPRWHDDRIWVSDLYRHEVISIGADGDVRIEATLPGDEPSGLGWLPDGRLLITAMESGRIMRRERDGEIVVHADLSSVATGKLNDMVVAADGTAYVGSFGFEFKRDTPIRPANLVRVSPDGTFTVEADDLLFPNGMVITPDNTLVVAESMGNRLTAFDIGSDGSLSNQRTWAGFGPELPRDSVKAAMSAAAVAPDGIGLDSSGAVWVADALNRRVVRVVEGGRIIDEVHFPTGVFACMLGGPDGDTLYACAAPNSSEAARRHTRDASLLATRVDATHGGRP